MHEVFFFSSLGFSSSYVEQFFLNAVIIIAIIAVRATFSSNVVLADLYMSFLLSPCSLLL